MKTCYIFKLKTLCFRSSSRSTIKINKRRKIYCIFVSKIYVNFSISFTCFPIIASTDVLFKKIKMVVINKSGKTLLLFMILASFYSSKKLSTATELSSSKSFKSHWLSSELVYELKKSSSSSMDGFWRDEIWLRSIGGPTL